MAFGRGAIQSNVIAPFMLQQCRRMASSPTSLRHARTGGPTFMLLGAEYRSEARHVPFLARRLAHLFSPRQFKQRMKYI
jgi:hypothetical protein